jgi:hypothetical protein
MPKGDTEDTAALALNAGVDLEMGSSQWPAHLAAAVRAGKTSEANVTRSVKRALRPLFRAGRFDPVEQVKWAQLPAATVNSSEHQAALHQAALQGITLLQNQNQTLPLSQKGTKLAVLGPMAFVRDDMISDYGDGNWRHQNACWNGPPGSAVRTLHSRTPIRRAALGLIRTLNVRMLLSTTLIILTSGNFRPCIRPSVRATATIIRSLHFHCGRGAHGGQLAPRRHDHHIRGLRYRLVEHAATQGSHRAGPGEGG